jgi:chemotaxis signal transduction protein
MTDFTDISILPRNLGLTDEATEAERERRELLVMRAGARLLGVFADEANGVTEWRRPTPLPRASLAVLGVVSIRGCIWTVLDPLALVGERDPHAEPRTPGFIVSLRGDEQLALAVERAERIIEIFTDEVEPVARGAGAQAVVRGVVQRGRELIAVLDTEQLFAHKHFGLAIRDVRAEASIFPISNLKSKI